tara:strand:- start:23562 stop:24521 length:960 start_codon:yes stop_codon:yes gene_type:complete
MLTKIVEWLYKSFYYLLKKGNDMQETEFYIDEKDWNKIQQYCQYAYDKHKSEIGGMLLAELDKDNNYRLFEPTILKQEISMANTVLDKDELANYYSKIGMKYDNVRFVWWHSHHTMSAFWSGTDLTAIDEMANGTMSLSLVVNLKEEYKFRVNIWKPIQTFEDIELKIIRKDKKINKSVKKEVDKLCNTEKPEKSWNNTKQTSLAFPGYRYKPEKEISLNKSYYQQIVSKTETIHQDYEFSMKSKEQYKEYKNEVVKTNKILSDNNVMYRILLLNKKQLDDTVDWLPVESVIYNKNTNCSFDDIMIEYQYDIRQESWES